MLYNSGFFDKMDTLSQQSEPFFFMIDFLKEKALLLPENEIENSGLLIDFQNFISIKETLAISDDLIMHPFPQSLESYKKGFSIVQEQLKQGNSYLANYTCKTEVETNKTLEELFYLSKAPYKVCFPEHFVFFSPETFVTIKENIISTFPMKGTIEADLPDAENILKNDTKELAEHYTVVDLLRNDLSMVAHHVEVKKFQMIEKIKTNHKDLFAMSSEISGYLRKDFQGKIGKIMQTILPAGSILGAPKAKTMEVILQAELFPRNFYCGVAGYFDGKNLDSCVMIRFIEKENGKLFFRSGGGITHLSDAEKEYQEMKNKIYVPIF